MTGPSFSFNLGTRVLSELLCTVSSFILPLSTHKESEHTACGSLAVILREDGCWRIVQKTIDTSEKLLLVPDSLAYLQSSRKLALSLDCMTSQ